jgi:lipopolysaccharide transport system ATP-binding protein
VSDVAISIENVSKFYRLGSLGNRTLYQDLNRWWASVRGRPDPLLKIGEAAHGNRSADGLWALDDVSLEIKSGDVLGIIGHNGAGKSTLLKILSRVTGPTSGQIRVRGRIASLLEVGTGFHPDLSGRENIFLNGAILGMTRAEIRRKFDEIVDFADVEKFIDTPVKRYSSGMYVRLAFAVAAHLEPEILVVDEVLAVGDMGFRRKCLGKMEAVSNEGRTVLFVSHDLQSIWSLCKSAIWMRGGRIAAQGSAPEVIDMYRASLSDHGVRSLDGVLRAGSGKLRVRDIHFLGADNAERDTVRCGEECSIVIDYAAMNEARLDDVEFYVAVTDERKVRLATLSNVLSGERFNGLASAGQLRCRIPKLPLAPGEYELSVACKVGPELVDKFVVPTPLMVTEGRFAPNGELLGESFGSLLIEHGWSLATAGATKRRDHDD